MAIFLGTRNENILEWRGVAELLATLRGELAERMAVQVAGENIALLNELTKRLETEIDFDEKFSAGFGRLLDQLEQAGNQDEFPSFLSRFNRMAQDYFRERGSAIAVHALCGAYRDALVRKALGWVAESLEKEKARRPPAPYCWFAGGSAGRQEQTFCVDPTYYLIYGDADDDAPDYFEEFSRRAAALLARIGLVAGDNGAPPRKNLWLGGRNAWRKEIIDKFRPRERKGIETLLERADLRLIAGDRVLADEMLNVVRSMLGFHQEDLREAAVGPDLSTRYRTTVSRPVPLYLSIGRKVAEGDGLDFFGRLKVEKSGRNRGMFALDQRAIAPLVAKVRILALEFGLDDTGTVSRIKRLQEEGRLSVELAERLLAAFHDFSRLKIRRQIEAGCESERACFIYPQELTEDDEKRLKAGMAAVGDLDKIIYLCFTEQGQ
jgi:CBS domain-containing protein